MLSPGDRLGPYEVVAAVGAGGMGEVYRCRDTRLGREVAIKVLPAERMGDAKTRRRFLQEARAASSLNHPNIVTIHEIGAADGIDFLVMEHVPGATLKDLLVRGALAPDEALRIGGRIAQALARAHAAGIVHCDLKPANVVVGPDGVVKVLDFGLARLLAPGRPGVDAGTTESGGTGSLLQEGGTVGYMSPEQAMGKPLDPRTDVFSFGVTLYEMVAGRRAFAGESTAEVVAAIIRDEPVPLVELQPLLPRGLDRLIERCLRKDRSRRFQTMIDVGLELEEVERDSRAPRPPRPLAARRSGRRWPQYGVALAGTAALAVLAFWLWAARRPAPPPPRLVTLLSLGGLPGAPSFSPDGEQVAFHWTGDRSFQLASPRRVNEMPWHLYITMPGSSETRQVTAGGADFCPSWSPDGRQIAFNRRTGDGWTLNLVSPLGGTVRQLGDLHVSFAPPSWSPDGRWLAVPRPGPRSQADPEAGGVALVPLDGGAPRSLARASPGGWTDMPLFSHDGRKLAFVACFDSLPPLPACEIQVLRLGPDYGPVGPPLTFTARRQPVKSLAWGTDDEEIVYTVNYGNGHALRARLDGRLPPERLELAGVGVGDLATPPSRKRLAFARSRFNDDIYRFVPGQPPAPLAGASSFLEVVHSFSPDGRRIAFESTRSGRVEAWLSAADGTSAMQLTDGPGSWQGSPRWSPDGERIAFDSQGRDGRSDIWTVAVSGGAPRRLTTDPGDENGPSWSRDGRFVYFSSARAGARDVFRVPADGGTEERVTRQGAGYRQLESIDGRALYVTREDKLYEHTFATGVERLLVSCVQGGIFDVAADGIYYPECDEELSRRLHRLDPRTGVDRVLGVLDGFAFSLAASPDGRTILFTRIVGFGNDLMMIDNFR